MTPTAKRDIESVLQGAKSYDELGESDQAVVREKWSDLIADGVTDLDLMTEFAQTGRSWTEADEEGRAVSRHPESFTERMVKIFPWMLALSAEGRELCARDLLEAAPAPSAGGQPHLDFAKLTAWQETATAITTGLGQVNVGGRENDEPGEPPLIVPAKAKEIRSAMTLTLGTVLHGAGIDPLDAQVIRHAYVVEPEGTGIYGIHADSTDDEILLYTSRQSAVQRVFPPVPPKFWIVFVRDGGNRARLWAVVENRGEISNDGAVRTFDLVVSEHMADLQNRLVIGWRSPRAWRITGPTAAGYPVMEIADAEPVPFPGFDRLVLDYAQLQAVMREHRYASWRTALSSVVGIYLITDTLDGRHYVGKADGLENIRQRWGTYAANGHGGNVGLKGRDPNSFRYSLLRVFDPSTPTSAINEAESHFKMALDTRKHGLNLG